MGKPLTSQSRYDRILEDLASNHYSPISTTGSELTFKCPSCLQNSLKVNSVSKLFACYNIDPYTGRGCGFKRILRALGVSNYTTSDTVDFFKEIILDPLPRYIDKNAPISLCAMENLPVAQKTTYYRNAETKDILLDVTKLEYPYSDDKKIIRIDFGPKDKTFRAATLINEHWRYKKESIWPVYRNDVKDPSPGAILFVEGEKCVHYGLTLGVTTLTVCGADFNAFNLKYILDKDSGLVNEILLEYIYYFGIVFISDNDKAGKTKARVLDKVTTQLKIPYLHIAITDLVKTLGIEELQTVVEIKGYDLADLIENLITINYFKQAKDNTNGFNKEYVQRKETRQQLLTSIANQIARQ